MTQKDNKKKANYTLDPATIDRLKEYSDKSYIPQSRIVDLAINMYIDKQEEK